MWKWDTKSLKDTIFLCSCEGFLRVLWRTKNYTAGQLCCLQTHVLESCNGIPRGNLFLKNIQTCKGTLHRFAAFFLEYLKQWRIRHTSAYYIRFSVFFFLCATFTAGVSMAMRLWFMVKCLWNMIRVQMLSDLIIKLLNLVKQLVHWFWKILNENTPRKKTISTYGWRTT